MSTKGNPMTELDAARERLEDAIDCSGAAREDDEIVAVRAGDLRIALTALYTRPSVVPEGVAREIAEALADHDADAADAAERGERSDGWVIEISPASARAILSLLARGG
jgi:hypothetical protein